jgi:hypothetical protein
LRLELALEENILRYKLTLKDRLHLEWSWQEELSRGGLECTILAHISTSTNTINVLNKSHFHWRATEAISVMNNEVKFSASAHNLLLKSGSSRIDHHAYKHRMASIQSSPQSGQEKEICQIGPWQCKAQPQA